MRKKRKGAGTLYYVAEYDTIEEELHVWEVMGWPFGAREVELERAMPALRHGGNGVRVSLNGLSTTPDRAVVLWRKEQEERVASLKRKLREELHRVRVVGTAGYSLHKRRTRA